MSPLSFDLVIIGGGPAGLAAAAIAAQAGVSTAVIDSQAEPGGQIYRAATRRAKSDGDAEVKHGAQLVTQAFTNGMQWLGGRSVWQVTPELQIYVSDGTTVQRVTARRLIVATGALERPMPIPGWTLPGVMTAGAGQILLKGSRIVPDGDVWMAGSGPLLLLLAAQWVRAGVSIRGVLDTTPLGNVARAFPHSLGAVAAWPELRRGLTWWREIQRAGVPWIRVDGRIAAEGRHRLERIVWAKSGRVKDARATTLFLHQGVIPNARVVQSLGAEMRWDALQRAYAPIADEWGCTSLAGVYIAGDCGGIVGAGAAEVQGKIAALHALHALGRLDRRALDDRAVPLRRELRGHLRMRPFLDAAFMPAKRLLTPKEDGVVVCRCEGVTAGSIRQALNEGAPTANDVKLATRCAMGPCQGRQCSDSLQEIVAAHRATLPSATSSLLVRSPIEPVTLGELAQLAAASAQA